MKPFSRGLVLILLLAASPAAAIQLPCGEHELIGLYHPAENILEVAPRTNGALPIFLTGTKVVTALGESAEYYRVKVEVLRKVGDEGGAARLREVVGLAEPSEFKNPVLASLPGACAK